MTGRGGNSYAQWKDGVSLPQGVLQATSTRWGEHFKFVDVVLTTDSPTDIVVKAPKPIVYRGRVVDGLTGEPMPAVFVETYRTHSPEDLRSPAGDPLQQFGAGRPEVGGRSPQLLYQASNRATVTDANGVFQFTFIPGLGWSRPIHNHFSATAPDRREGYVDTFSSPLSLLRSREGPVDVGTIKLLRPEDKTHPFPTMVFHDKTGPVTDPNRLKAIEIEIRTPGRTMMGVRPYDQPLEEREFMAGTYYAEAEMGSQTLHLRAGGGQQSSGGVHVPSPKDRESRRCVRRTSRPCHHRSTRRQCRHLAREGTPEYDPACLTSEQWAAIRALGPRIDPATQRWRRSRNLASGRGYLAKDHSCDAKR